MLAFLLTGIFVTHDINYSYNDQGKSTITQDISLKNLTTQYYPTQYQLQLVGENPQNISSSFPVTSEVQDADTTLVTVDITKPAIGKDKVTRFNLKYQGKPALHNGQVWEISLPRLANPKSIDALTLNLSVPSSFGKPAYLSPPPISSNENIYSFTKEQLIQSPIVGAFGNFQTFAFSIDYRLTGTSVITLPPDTAYQRVFYDSLTPPPSNIKIDPDGNWLATYKLKSKQSLDVTARGQVHILSEPLSSFPEPNQKIYDYVARNQQLPNPVNFALAIHGQSDTASIFTPPTVKLSYSSYKEYPNLPLTQRWENPPLIIPYIPAKFNLVFENPNGQAIYLNPVAVPPFSRLSIPYFYTYRRPLDFSPQTVMSYNIPRRLFLPWQIFLATTISLTIVSGSLSLQKLVGKHHLHR